MPVVQLDTWMVFLITGQEYVRSYCKNQHLGAEIITDFWCSDQGMNCSLGPRCLSSTLQCYHLWDNGVLDHQVHAIKWHPNLNTSSLSPSWWEVLGVHQGAPQTRVGCMSSLEVHVGDMEVAVPRQWCATLFCKWVHAWPCAAG